MKHRALVNLNVPIKRKLEFYTASCILNLSDCETCFTGTYLTRIPVSEESHIFYQWLAMPHPESVK